jgi:hypothetical protein
MIRSALIGSVCGALVFALLSLAHAQQQVTVRDIRHNPKAYVGQQVTVTGLVGTVHRETKNGEDWVSFGIQEQDAKGKKTGYNVWVHLPVSAFQGQAPLDNSTVSVSGELKWPFSVARLGD